MTAQADPCDWCSEMRLETSQSVCKQIPLRVLHTCNASKHVSDVCDKHKDHEQVQWTLWPAAEIITLAIIINTIFNEESLITEVIFIRVLIN